MSLYPPTAFWTLLTVQKNLTNVGALGHAHNFLRLVDPGGEPKAEVNGTYDRAFTVFGPIPGNYLRVTRTDPYGFRNDLKNVAANPTIQYRSQEQAVAALARAYDQVARRLDATEMLYVGVRFVPFGSRAVNSNSVWRTLLTTLGVKNPSQYSGGLSAPGERTDLMTTESNNDAFLAAQAATPPGIDPSWTPNPPFSPARNDRYTRITQPQ